MSKSDLSPTNGMSKDEVLPAKSTTTELEFQWQTKLPLVKATMGQVNKHFLLVKEGRLLACFMLEYAGHFLTNPTNSREGNLGQDCDANLCQIKPRKHLYFRYVATELATDMVINVGDVKFYLHKFPLLSKSSHLQKLVANTSDETDEIHINDIPGGPAAFEICAKFCYGMVVTLNAYNVVAARCAAEYLEMYETFEKGNLIYKIDVFLTSSIFRSWKDSIIVLQTTKSLLPWSEELKIVSHCLDSIASKASVDPSKVDWSYTYNRKKLPSENGHDPLWNGVKKQLTVPKDWWVEDLCELQINLYKRAITTIQAKGRISSDVIGESLKAYISRRLPGFSKGTIQGGDPQKYRYLVDTITWLLPTEKNSVPCSFLLKLLQASYLLECEEMGRKKLMQKIAEQLGDATLNDLLIRSPNGEIALYNIGIVQNLVEQFVTQECSTQTDCADYSEFQEMYKGFTSDASKSKVAKLVDGYLAEAARDSSLTLSRFLDLADMVSCFPRTTHDGIYRAIDMYLKVLFTYSVGPFFLLSFCLH
ncbi:hypothetical protein DH2020_040930 [Rehmannia glutinosa]|uniref:BTB/POZ domain-containing protein n=1 Tax=Rehmannia glutinosa TaxID=99300 RepID=A0ABR0URK1_REHGL